MVVSDRPCTTVSTLHKDDYYYTTTTTIFSLQSRFVSCRRKWVMFLLGLYNLDVTLLLMLCQTSRLDFEPFMGFMTIEHWITLPQRHTFTPILSSVSKWETLSTQNTSTAPAQLAVLWYQYGNSVKLIVILRFVFFTPTISVRRLGVVLNNRDNMWNSQCDISQRYLAVTVHKSVLCHKKPRGQHPKKTDFCIPQNWARNCLPLP